MNDNAIRNKKEEIGKTNRSLNNTIHSNLAYTCMLKMELTKEIANNY